MASNSFLMAFRGRILILYNPVAGGVGTGPAASRLWDFLKQAGYESELSPTRVEPDDGWLDEQIEDAAALVVMGGDGSVRLAAGAAIRTGTPIYHVPRGTENLFAREFGMSRGPRALLATLQRRRIRWVDAGLANGRRFILMVSIGYDAAVVHDLASRRGASISHWTYGAPMLRQLRRWRPPALTVSVDDRPLDLGSSCGQVVVANCRQYMWGLNPARRADMSDGRLDVVYFPMRSRSDLIGWIARCGLGRQLESPRVRFERGTAVRITCAEPQLAQVDGDPSEGPGARTSHLDITIEAGVLPVLVPPEANPRNTEGL